MNEARKGSLFSVYVLESGDYRLLCGLQATSVTINQEGVDTTDNCSGSIRQMLEGTAYYSVTNRGQNAAAITIDFDYLLTEV